MNIEFTVMGQRIDVAVTAKRLPNGDYRVVNSAGHEMMVVKSDSPIGQSITKHFGSKMTCVMSIDTGGAT